MLLTTLGLAAAGAAAGLAVTGFIRGHAEQRHPPGGRFVAVGAGRLHLVDTRPGSPEAPTILLLHGASSLHADLFHGLGPRLSPQARVIAIDRPGHGWSDRLEGRAMADPARQAVAIMAALDAIEARRVVIIGHSLAGAVSVRLALEWPERIAGLVLLGAVTHPWPGAAITWYYHPTAAPGFGGVFSRLVAIPAGQAVLQNAIAGVFAPQPAPADYAETAQIRLVLRPPSFQANAEDVAAIYGFVDRQHHRHGELAMPVLAIAGEEDEVVWTDVHSRAIAAEARQGRLITLPGVGHMPHHVVPDLIAQEALALALSGG
jgi:pimeloyl-ACP methyl ester carboxylesterase